MRIWDLRRGDAEDDRTSPHGRGLRSLLVSAVLEFNYLKAPIGFFLLFVLPALLIGIAPSIVVDYGRLVAHTATAGESAIVLPVISLALIAIAWWIGRLLFEWLENFWQLHYSLVLPIFVVLRELLRAILEKIRGRAVTAEQLDHGRRMCAIIAALILPAVVWRLSQVSRFHSASDLSTSSTFAGDLSRSPRSAMPRSFLAFPPPSKASTGSGASSP